MAINRTEDYLPTADEFAKTDSDINARPVQKATISTVQSGWDAAEKSSVPAGDYPTEFKFTDGEYQIVKFLDQNGPFAVYKQHFLSQKTTGKRSYISLGANDPLCVKLGSKPEDKKAFSLAVLTASGVERQMLIASPRLYKTLHAAHFAPTGPLTKNYWAISRTGKMQSTAYLLNPVKARDLLEDWGIDVTAHEAALEALVPYEASAIKSSTWEELEAVADSLL